MSGLKCLHRGQVVLKAMLSSNSTDEDEETPPLHEPARKRQRLWEGGVMENGHGSIESNGNSPRVTLLGRHKRIDRGELVRLLIQQTYELGYDRVAAQLERVSGHKLELREVTSLRQAISAGEWATATRAISQLPVDEKIVQKATFLVLETKFVEVRLQP